VYLNHKDLSKYWVVDIETDGLTPTVIWCVVATNAATKETFKFRDRITFSRFYEANRNDYFVGHFFLSYDAPTLRRLWAIPIRDEAIVDTVVLSILYHPNMPGGHSLEAYGERFGFAKDLFNDFSRFSEELQQRCVTDVEINLRLFLRLTEKMRKVGFSEKSCELEHKVRVVINKQQERGFNFDLPKAEELRARLRAEEQRLAIPIRELFPPVLVLQKEYVYRKKKDGGDHASYVRHLEQYPEVRHNLKKGTYGTYDWQEFNIGSPKQRLDKLLSLGFVPTKKTKSGGPSVDEESLVEFAKESGRAEVQAIADWLVCNGRANMVTTWLDHVADDGAIHGYVNSCGAQSRRMIHNSPNTANIPSNEAKYGEECRSLWTPRQGLKLLGYDAKAAQMRCFAHFLPDPVLGRRFYDTEFCPDPHQENAELIGIARKPIKNVFYANMFGAFPPKLATTAGRIGTYKELNEYGTWIQNELYRVTPGLREATQSARDEFNATPEHWMRCVDGGYVRGTTEHSAFNYRIQPAEACLMKQAAIFIDQRSKHIEHWKVGDIHDEGQHEVNPRQAHDLGQLCVQSIRDAGEELGFRVPMDGDYKIGDSWAKTH
jgi:DNA polymerase-1